MKPNFKSWITLSTFLSILAAATIWSCNKDDDPSFDELKESELAYLADSLALRDSLGRINQAGAVNYAITVVSGSTSTLYKNDGRTEGTQNAVADAIVTISQFGKTETDTTDASGMVVFTGFFRSNVNVTIRKTDFTTMTYIAFVKGQDSTVNNTTTFVGNIIPIFELTGANTATISGRAIIETNLTNSVRELAPDGTTFTASIDATNNSNFSDRFLTSDIEFDPSYLPCGGCRLLVGYIVDAAYETGATGTVTAGNYTITVPAAIDGLPLTLEYSEVAANQTIFETVGGSAPFNQAVVYRTLYGSAFTPSAIAAAGSVTATFDPGSGATATAIITPTGTLAQINVTNGGTGYTGTPLVDIVSATGTGATATAIVTNGVITGVTLTSPGTGYATAPTVSFISGTGAAASTVLGTGTVIAIQVNNTGAGYVTAPTVTITGGGATTDATAVANIANGRVTSITVTSGGVGYTGAAITVTIVGGTPTTNATATALFSGSPVNNVNLTLGGSNYTYAPSVTFPVPQLATGVRATGTAIIDPNTRQVIAINVTNAGSGYTGVVPITISAGTGAAATAILTGSAVISANIVLQGQNYFSAPTVVFTAGGGGSGAAGTAIVVAGHVVGINITSGGSGYTVAPTITLQAGSGAQARVIVTAGAVSGVTVMNGGANYTGAPLVTLSSGIGGGATATATVVGGQVTGVTVTAGGTGYVAGNTPSGAGVAFSASKSFNIDTKRGVRYINDIDYGTGQRQPN